MTYYYLKGYNKKGKTLYIIKTKQYIKEYKKKIINKHLVREQETIELLEIALTECMNLKELIHSDVAITYNIKKKVGDLKEIYTARINNKLRLYMKPVGEYPYRNEEIIEIEFREIDDKHYGEG